MFLLISAIHLESVDQIYEIKTDAPITSSVKGDFKYHPGLRVQDSPIPGIFSFASLTQANPEGNLRLFDSEPVATCEHKLTYKLNKAPGTQLGDRIFAYPNVPAIYATMISTVNPDQGGYSVAELKEASKPLQPDSNQEIMFSNPSRKVLQLVQTQLKRHRWLEATSDTVTSIVEIFNNQIQIQARIPHAAGERPVFIDQTFSWFPFMVYIDRSGRIYKDDETVIGDVMISSTVLVPDFHPKYARVDVSQPCDIFLCSVIVAEHNENPVGHYLTMLYVGAIGTQHGQLQFPRLDVTELGLLSPPIQPASIQRFAIMAGNTFYSFKIFGDRFERDLTFPGPAITGYVPGSLDSGKFDVLKYSGLAPAMFVVQSGGNYVGKMFVFDTTGCRARKADGTCGELCTEQTCPPGPPAPPETPNNPDGGPGSGCSVGSVSFNNHCIQCDSVAPSAILVENDLPKCIKTDASPYLEGYREVQTTPFRVIEMCSQTGCKKCPADKDVCTECKEPSKSAFNYAARKLYCPSVSPVWPTQRVRREILRNLVDLLFDSLPSPRPLFDVKVVDLNSGRVFGCGEVGCVQRWEPGVLRLTFDSEVQVTRGLLMIIPVRQTRLLGTYTNSTRRELASMEPEFMVVQDFQLVKRGWFFSWTTVTQLVVWLFRTLGSLLLFGRYPVTAMAMDWFVTHSVLLALYLGPFLTTSELALKIVGQVKLVWYWYPNPFHQWDPATLGCTARPGHGTHGLLCSFFDNYGQNVIGFAAMGVLMALLHCLAGWMLRRVDQNSKISQTCRALRERYGTKYMIAKLDANQLEILMYVLISYSLADSSSKSVVGLVLATVLLLFFALVTVGRSWVLWSIHSARTSTRITQVSLPVATQEHQNLSNPSHIRASPTTEKPSRHTIRELLGYSQVNTPLVSRNLQILGPLFRFLRTLAVCILLLNHSTDASTQLVIGILLETAYLVSLIFTRTDQWWVEFYGAVGLQALVVLFLILKAVSTDKHIPRIHNQEEVAILMSVMVLAMFVSVCGWMTFVVIDFYKKAGVQFGQPDPNERKAADSFAKVQESVKLGQVQELELPQSIPAEAQPAQLAQESFHMDVAQENPVDHSHPSGIPSQVIGELRQSRSSASLTPKKIAQRNTLRPAKQ